MFFIVWIVVASGMKCIYIWITLVCKFVDIVCRILYSSSISTFWACESCTAVEVLAERQGVCTTENLKVSWDEIEHLEESWWQFL